MSVKAAWEVEADLGNRDPNNLNDHLKVSALTFQNIFNIFLPVINNTVNGDLFL